jgi:SAM-dependent methyltransferase
VEGWDGGTAEWWAGEVATDPAYSTDVDPLLRSLVPSVEGVVVDLGCGEGRVAGILSGLVGVDLSLDLARQATRRLPVSVADVTRLPLASGSVAGGIAVLVLEHVADMAGFFTETNRVVTAGGFLVVIINHPNYTAPGSGPFVDPDDGEVLWRWGSYLSPGHTDEPAGAGTVRFHHRPMGDLLRSAADAGWSLETMEERAVSPAEDPLLAAQSQVPRLLGVRWRR